MAIIPLKKNIFPRIVASDAPVRAVHATDAVDQRKLFIFLSLSPAKREKVYCKEKKFIVAIHPQDRHYRAMTIKPEHYGLIEMGMTFGIVAIFTIYQLWSLREKPPKDDDETPD